MTVRISSVYVLAYFALALAFMLAVGMAALEEEVDLQFYADTLTYERIAEEELLDGGSVQLISVGANYLGPVLILRALAANKWAIMGLNMAIFVGAMVLLARVTGAVKPILITVVAANPMTFSSLLSLNKEVLALATTAFLVAHLHSRSVSSLAAALIVGFLTRWQMALIVLVTSLATSVLNPFRRRPLLSLAAFVVVLSIAYPPLLPVFEAVEEQAASASEQMDNERSGLYREMLAVQNKGGYWLVVVPKALHGMFGLLARPDSAFDMENFYNSVIVMLHALVMLLTLTWLVIRGGFRLRDPLIVASLYLVAFFALTPVYAPRYFYPVFVLWAVALARSFAPVSFVGPLAGNRRWVHRNIAW